jgi:HSP20 family protein
MSVMRFDSFRDFDRFTQQLFGEGGRRSGPQGFPLDAYRRGDRFYVHLDLPGVDPDSIDLTCERNVLTIRAERSFQSVQDDEVIVSERPQGNFSRQLFVSEALDTDAIDASYDQGVLTLEIPVAEQAKPKRIEISRSHSGRQTIEGRGNRPRELGDGRERQGAPAWQHAGLRMRRRAPQVRSFRDEDVES